MTSSEGTIVPSLLDYLRVLGRRKLVFLLIVLLVPATAIAASLRQAPAYRASAEVLLTPRDLGTAYNDPQRAAQTRATLARVPAVVNRVLAEVPSAGLDRKEFLESSTVSATLGSDILTFSVENSDPRLAMRLATEYANAFTEYQQQLDDEAVEDMLDQLRQQIAQLAARGEGEGSPNYDALQRREETLAAASAAQSRSARVVNPAVEAPKVGPRTLRNGLIAFCLGLVLALVVVFLADALDTRVRSVDTIREALGLRLLGRLATPPSRLRKRNDLVMLADPTSPDADEFRALRWSLDLANAEQRARTLMLTSAIDGEGKSTTVANLAVAFARAGRRVVLIDADLGNPTLHRLFDLEQRPGLTDVELGETWLVEALRPVALAEDSSGAEDSSRRTEHTGSLELLPAGSALRDPDEIGFDEAMGRIIMRVRGRADIVLVDAPPVLRSNGIAMSAHVDAVVVVTRLKALRTPALQELSWILEASPAPRLGFVLTGVDKRVGYGPYHRYGRPERRRAARPQPTSTVAPSATDGDGDVPGRRRAETQAGARPTETTGESETDGGGDQRASGATARPRSKSPGRPFGGLSPREAALKSAKSRKAKSAQRAQAAQRTAPGKTQDAGEDA